MTKLKKEFKKKDVQRLRNLITKNMEIKLLQELVIKKLKNFMKKEIYGKKMVVNGLLEKALNKI